MEAKYLILVALVAFAYAFIGMLCACAMMTRLPASAWEAETEANTKALLLVMFAAWPVAGMIAVLVWLIDWLRR